jgi:hypothetical protein
MRSCVPANSAPTYRQRSCRATRRDRGSAADREPRRSFAAYVGLWRQLPLSRLGVFWRAVRRLPSDLDIQVGARRPGFAPELENYDGTTVLLATWLDAQHPYMATAHRVVERTALHAGAAAMAATGTVRIPLRLITLQEVAGAFGAALAAAPAAAEAAQGRGGRQPVRP